MNRSLLLLIGLRARAWSRLWGRNLRTLKGVLLALVGSLVFLPLIGSALLAPRLQTAAQLDVIRRYGPLGLLAYCVLNVLLSSGDRAVYYTPAEVNFLFSGPYRPRQLLLYKVAVGFGTGSLTALFMTMVFRQHAALFVPAYVGLFLALQLLYLFSLALGLVGSTFGALAYGRGRVAVVVGLLLVLTPALLPLGREALALPPGDVLDRLMRSRSVGVILLPFRPFVMAFTAERVWPDLAGWAALAALVDAALLGLVLALNAQFLEASAAASVRIYERARAARRGVRPVAATKARFSLPMLPWWGGVGPNLWRQFTTVSRSPSRLLSTLVLYALPVGSLLLVGREGPNAAKVLAPLISVFFTVTFIASSVAGFDFRFDLGRMEDLRGLPIRPTRLALSQLLTPVLILSAGQWVSFGLLAWRLAPDPGLAWTVAAFVLPANLILVAVENLYFLWFPYRATGINSFDFQAIGRQLLLMLAKLLTAGLAAAVATGVGFAAYYLTGRGTFSAVGCAWLAALGCGLALVPLVALAFEQYDVAGESIE